MDENKTHPYAAYKRLTQIVGRKPKVTGWKRQSLQMKTKKAGENFLKIHVKKEKIDKGWSQGNEEQWNQQA